MIPIFKYILLYFVLIFNFGCESKKVVPNDLFSKMISHRNVGLAYLEEERYADAVIEFKALLKISKTEVLEKSKLYSSFFPLISLFLFIRASLSLVELINQDSKG